MRKDEKKERKLLESPMAKANKRLYDYLSRLYDNAEIIHLQEQKFNKTKRVFYHISKHCFSVFKASTVYGTEEPIKEQPNLDKLKDERAGLVFLSPKIDFCIYFFNLQNKEKNYAFLYECRLVKTLNLFNASSEEDLAKLKKVLRNNEYAMFIHNIKDYGNDRFWIVVEQDHVNAIHKLGYDGLCSFGNGKDIVGKDFHNAENIGIFNPSNISISARKKIDIRKYKTIRECLESVDSQPKVGDFTIRIGLKVIFGRDGKYWTGRIADIYTMNRKEFYEVLDAVADDGEVKDFSFLRDKDISQIVREE